LSISFPASLPPDFQPGGIGRWAANPLRAVRKISENCCPNTYPESIKDLPDPDIRQAIFEADMFIKVKIRFFGILHIIPFAIINLPKENRTKVNFVYRPYGTSCYGNPLFYRYFVPGGTMCKPANEGCQKMGG